MGNKNEHRPADPWASTCASWSSPWRASASGYGNPPHAEEAGSMPL